MNKASILLRGPDQRPVLEAPVTWERLPYLAATPNRVTLGAHPVRVFLRCPDENAELTRVVHAPSGIKAVVSSTREVTVMLAASAPTVIDGEIEVGTNVSGRGLLKIPVARYAPSGHAAALKP